MAFLKIEPNSSASFGGTEYKAGDNGVVEIPDEHLAAAVDHGCEIIPEPEKPKKVDAKAAKKGEE